jgi:Domain of unknown function (DUF4234)
MAYDIEIGQTQATVRVRRPWAVALLSILTLGIYSVVWYYKVNREMRDYGASRGDSDLAGSKPVQSVLAVTIGGVLVIPTLVSYVRMVGRVQRVERIATGESRGGAGLIALLLGSVVLGFLAGFAGFAFPSVVVLLGVAGSLSAYALIQSRLNAVWKRSGAVADPVAVDTLDWAEGSPAGMASGS